MLVAICFLTKKLKTNRSPRRVPSAQMVLALSRKFRETFISTIYDTFLSFFSFSQSMNKNRFIIPLLFLLSLFIVTATTLQGTIYNTYLEPETDVLVEINTVPEQRLLARTGTYQFDVSPGTYTLTAQKEDTIITEEVTISTEGTFVYDLFLLPDFTDEEDLWYDTTEELLEEEQQFPWQYLVVGTILLLLAYRFYRARKKYGPLFAFRKKIKAEAAKTIEQHKEELAQEPGYIEKAVEIIKKHDGRITQKELRKEMLYLSEAKISLILTELEHKGRIEKIKKGRGNVIVLRHYYSLSG